MLALFISVVINVWLLNCSATEVETTVIPERFEDNFIQVSLV